MNKTIYVRDEDEGIWDRAKELARAKGISTIIVHGLKKFIAEKEAAEATARGFERIQISFNDADAHFMPKSKAFHGKWIIPFDTPEIVEHEGGEALFKYAVAITPKGSVVVYWVEEDREGRAQHFNVYPSLESAIADPKVNWAARKAIEIVGVPVEELDI